MDPAVAKELFQRAVELFGQEDYAGALSCYEQLSAAFPRNNDVVHERIQCQIALGRFQEAAEWIRYLGDELGDLRANVLQTQIPEGAESAVQSGAGSPADETLLGRFLRFTSTLSDGTLALLAVLLVVAIFGMYFYLVAFPKMYRLLPFNENTSIGTLDIRDPESENPVWTPWRDAQGKMYASRKMQLRLNLTKLADDSGYSSLRLNTLADFEPDSFWEVDASDSGIGDDGLRELAVLSGVHHMNLRNADIVGSGFVLFLPETTVETLDISDNPFESEWLPWVAQFETMESLNIHDTRIDDEGLSHLAEHSGLRFLELPDDAGDDGLKHLGGLTGLESLDLSRRRVTDRGLSFLGGLESLRELNLSATSISDKGIASLIPLERLRSLNLSYTRVGDDALVSIGELVQLRTLDLTATRVTDIGLYSLAPLESLRSLNLSNHHTLSAITDSGIQALTELPLLEELDLSGSHIGRASVGLLGSLNLSELKLEETYLSESEAAELAALIPAATITHVPLTGDVVTFDGNDDLGMLWIRGQDQSDAGRWIPFASARGRVRLPVDADVHVYLSLDGVEQLSSVIDVLGAGRIRGLTFPEGYLEVDELDFTALGRAGNIEELHVPGGAAPSSLFEQINGMNVLVELDLRGATIRDADFALLTDLPSLETLDLSGSSIQQSGWSVLARFPNLSTLDLSGTSVEVPGSESLSGLGSLRSVDLRDTAIADDRVATLRESLPDAAILHYSQATREITFSDARSVGTLWMRPVSEGGEEVPWESVGSAQGVVRVPRDSQLRLDVPQDASFTADDLAELPTDAIHTLHMTGSQVTDETLAQIAHLESLEVLDLFATGITDAGLAVFSEADGSESGDRFPNLRSLNLAETSITDDGIGHLAKLSSLRQLDLARTQITDAGVDGLAELSSVDQLSLEGTRISRSSYETLAAARPDNVITYPTEVRDGIPGRSPEVRVLNVESDAPFGTLYIRDWRSTREEDWRYLGPIYGDAPIPGGFALKLEISAQDSLQLDVLKSLTPNILHTIAFARDTTVTASMLAALAPQRSLEVLILDQTVIAPGALSSISSLPRLKSLGLNQASFDEAELLYLRNIPWLEDLNVSATSISDESLSHLTSITELETLDAHSNKAVGDLGMRYLKRNASIRSLNVKESRITDKGIADVLENERLRMIDTFGTLVTETAAVQLAKEQSRVRIQNDKRTFDRYEIAKLKPFIERGIERARTITQVDLPKIIGVEEFADIAPDALQAVQQISVEALRQKGDAITGNTLATLSGETSLRDVPEEIRRPLQKIALNAIAQSDTRITYDDLSLVAGVQNFDTVLGEERREIQAMALSALATNAGGIVREDIPALENQTRFENIPEEAVPEIQAIALQAMANSDTGIEGPDLSAVAGVDSFSSITGDYKIQIQDMALQAMSNSDTGIQLEDLAMLESASGYDAITSEELKSLQTRSMNIIVLTEQGVRSGDIAELGGKDYYEDLSAESMESLQKLALSSMADNNVIVTSETVAQIGGRDEFGDLPEDRLENLQTYALSSMSNSERGITMDVMVELSGLEDFTDFTQDMLEPMQEKALTAMADSYTGITLDGLATVVGADEIDDLSEEKLAPIRSLAVTAMAKSVTGIQANQLGIILGDGVLEELDLSESGISDVDLLNIASLADLREVNLSGCKDITDTGISYLAQAFNMEEIRLARTSITNAALSSMWEMKSLRVLDVSDTSVSDNGLSALVYLPSLEDLYLGGTRVGGSGLAYLDRLPELRVLNLSRTGVDDDALDLLPAEMQLTKLYLNQTDVGDYSLRRIGKYTGLEELEIAECANISDAGFSDLSGLTGLRRLSVYGTEVSDSHVDELTLMRSLESLYVDLAMFDSSAFDILRSSLPLCRIEGIASLIPRVPVQLVAPSSTFERVYTTGGKFIYTMMLAGASFLILIVPFAPMYMRYLLRYQEYALPGRILRGVMVGGQLSGLVINRGGRAFTYTFRWFIFLAVAGVAIYLFVQLGIYIFDTYYMLDADR